MTLDNQPYFLYSITMTLETAELNVGCYFWSFNRRCRIVLVNDSEDVFEKVVHYCFKTVDNGNPISGWIPAELVGQCELTA